MRTHPHKGDNSTVRSRRLALPHEPPSGPISRRAGPRTSAGNGKTMAESTKKITHKRAKGRAIDGKSTRRTTGRAGARGKRPIGPQKTAQAEAQKRKKRTFPRNLRIHFPGAGRAAGTPHAAESGKYGIDRLTQEIDRMLENESTNLARALVKQIAEGHAGSARIAVALTEKMKRKEEMESNQERLRETIDKVQSEPEFEEPARDEGQTDKPQPGVVETMHAVAED